MNEQKLSIKLLKDAAKTLDIALNTKPLNDIVRDAVIQRFEYTYELAWKTLKRYFDANQKATDFNIKDIWREAAKSRFIENLEDWFEFHKARNETPHTYNKKLLDVCMRRRRNLILK